MGGGTGGGVVGSGTLSCSSTSSRSGDENLPSESSSTSFSCLRSVVSVSLFEASSSSCSLALSRRALFFLCVRVRPSASTLFGLPFLPFPFFPVPLLVLESFQPAFQPSFQDQSFQDHPVDHQLSCSSTSSSSSFSGLVGGVGSFGRIG